MRGRILAAVKTRARNEVATHVCVYTIFYTIIRVTEADVIFPGIMDLEKRDNGAGYSANSAVEAVKTDNITLHAQPPPPPLRPGVQHNPEQRENIYYMVTHITRRHSAYRGQAVLIVKTITIL